jgi:hypothetical protein
MANIKTKARILKSKVKKAVKGLEPITTFGTGENNDKTTVTLRKNMPNDDEPGTGPGRRGVINWETRIDEAPHDPNSLTSQIYGVREDKSKGRRVANPSSDSTKTKIDWTDWSINPKLHSMEEYPAQGSTSPSPSDRSAHGGRKVRARVADFMRGD